MKIGIDARELKDGEITGTGRYLSNLLKYAPVIKPDWEYVLFTNRRVLPGNFSLDGLRIKFIEEPTAILWDQILLPRNIKRERLDVFFSPYYKAPLLCPCALVISILDILFLKAPFYNRPGRSLYNAYIKNMISVTARKSAAIITISENSKKDLISTLGLPEEKIRIVRLAQEERFKPAGGDSINKVKSKYGLERPYILYVGNLEPHKNVQGLIKAYAGLPEKLMDENRLVIIGKSRHYREALSVMAVKLRLGSKASFLDCVDDDDLPALYSGANLFVFPSFYEGFGLPPLESISCGTPVIYSNAASLPEVIGDAGVMIDPGNIPELSKAMERLLSDARLRAELRESGLKRAALFNARDTAAKMLDIFAEI